MATLPAEDLQSELRADARLLTRVGAALVCILTLMGLSLAFVLALPLFVASLLWWTWNSQLRNATAPPHANRSIRRCNSVDLASLFRDERPAVITGVVDRWSAFERWTPEYLKSKFGQRSVEVLCASSDEPVFTGDPVEQRRASMSFADLIDRIFGDPNSPERYYAWGSGCGGWKLLEPLVDELDIPKGSARHPFSVRASGLWIGHAGNITTLHFDPWHGLIVQLRGRKRVVLFPPNAAPNLYLKSPFHFPRTTDLPNRCMTADPEQFPKLRNAGPYEFVLEPGQMLFIPAFWWHEVESLENGISIPLRYDVSILRCLICGLPIVWPVIYYAFHSRIEKLRSLVLRRANVTATDRRLPPRVGRSGANASGLEEYADPPEA